MDSLLNISSVNPIKMVLIQEMALVFKVEPSANVHILPEASIVFTISLTAPLDSGAIANGTCTFGNQINREWQVSKLKFVGP